MAMAELLVLTLLAVPPTAAAGPPRAPVLDARLAILEPMVDRTWVGRIKSLDGDEFYEITRRFDVVWNGAAIRISGGCKALDNLREGFIYWDGDRKEIALFLINNKGTFQRGRVTREEGRIVISGRIVFPERSLEFRNLLEITPEGRLIDRWFRREGGEWLAGHSLEMDARE